MNEAVVGTRVKRKGPRPRSRQETKGWARHRAVSGPTRELRSAGAARQAIDVEEGDGATLQADPASRHEVGEGLVHGLA